MRKLMISKPLKLITISILSIIFIYIGLLFLHNQNTLIITMSSEKGALKSQFYFTTQGKSFIEENSCRNYKVKQSKYYYNIPPFSSIQYIRFDPSTTITDISIKNITIIRDKWFKVRTYDIPVKNIIPRHQINNFKLEDNSISFTTSGKDPQLNIHFYYQEVSVYSNYHIELLLIAILFYILIQYLFYIYQTQTLDTMLISKLILYSLFLSFTLFKVTYYKENIHFGYPPDELAHLSYIQYVNTHHEVLPKFKDMVMINNKSAGNYLSHPSLYYQIMTTVYDENYSIIQNVDNFRSLNIILFIASFLLILYLGFSSKISLLSHFVYLTFISSIPMLGYLGASITNDNLALLGALIFILGFKRILERDYTTFSYFILGLGIFISYFSKLTVAILLFFTILLYFIYLLKTKQKFKISRIQITLLVIFSIPILYYQYYIISQFHALVPTFNVTHPLQYLQSGFYIPEEHRHYLSLYEWLLRMKQYIIEGWFGIHSHHSLIKEYISEYIGILLLHIMAIITIFYKCDNNSRIYCLLGKIGMLSLFLLMIVQYFFSYKAHLSSGYMGGLQPRYLLPFMFAFAIMASLFVERFKQYFLFNIFIIIICIHALYSDFFYFLLYYQ